MAPLLSVAQAGDRLRSLVPVRRTERVPLDLALGRVLAREIRADRDLPPYDRICVDGYALRMADWKAGCRDFRVAGAAFAGAPRHAAPEMDCCIEVMTGSVCPEGCDAVVRLEDAMWAGEGRVLFEKVRVGGDIHVRGQDVKAGSPVLHAQTRLGAPELAVLASVGCPTPEVLAFPRVAILTTGDELVGASETPLGHQIRRSNDRFVEASLHGMGFPPSTRLHLPDDEDLLCEGIRRALERHDVLILSGGVSVSRRDLVPSALERAGVRQVFHKIAQRPGKPMWSGAGPENQFVAALPGNPVAAAICFVRHVRPVLSQAVGLYEGNRSVRLDTAVAAHETMTKFVAVRLREDGAGQRRAMATEGNGSGDFLHLVGTEGFVEIPPGPGRLAEGSVVRFHPWAP
ncbi:MAG: hypothetical protein RL318_2643 [Fibrobacterota bacterium]|jgi:molybdopterin molybdotransferase